jgi:hypothetical protein
MSVRNGIVLIATLATLSLLVACGGGSPAPNPVGATKNSLDGTYVFSSIGTDTNGLYLALTGTLTANGTGGITGGTMDLIGGDILTPTPVAQPISGGTYTIGADGRGQITINTTTLNPQTTASEGVNFTLDFVLESASHGQITEYDNQGSGSGTIDLQSAVTQSQLTGSYTFGISGTGIGTSPEPYSAVGAMTLSSTGAATSGIEDINNAGTPSNPTITASSGVNLGTTPPSAVIGNSGGAAYTFDVYPIDNTHFKLIETDGQLYLAGDAYTSGTSLPIGATVYTMEGYDASGYPIGEGGWLDFGSTGTTTAGLEDFDDVGTLGSTSSIAGALSTLIGGRSELSFTAFVNGAANDVPSSYLFAAYPFTYTGGSGVQLLEIDGAGVTSGALYPQTSTGLAATNYGLNLSAVNFGGVADDEGEYEEDDIAQFLTTSTGFTGAVDINDEGTLTFDKSLSGSFTNTPAIDSNGRGVATSNYFNFNFYSVDGSTFLVLETDDVQTGTGTFQSQAAISTGSARQPVSLLRPMMHRGALKKKQQK